MNKILNKICPPSKPAGRPPVPEGVTRICVAGFKLSHHTGRARAIADAIADAYPNKYETWFYFDSRGFRPDFLASIEKEITDNGGTFPTGHQTSPLVWFERSSSGSKTYEVLGGRDRLAEWAMNTFKESNHELIWNLSREEPPHVFREIKFDSSTPGTAATE